MSDPLEVKVDEKIAKIQTTITEYTINDIVNLPKGNYLVEQDIMIEKNGVLQIAPGTTFKFAPKTGITSYGVLRAMGTEENPITFTAQKNKWKNIAIIGLRANSSIFEYCDINKGKGRAFEDINLRELGLEYYESKSFAVHSGGGGIMVIKSSPTISHCKIHENNTTYGGGICTLRSTAEIRNNTVTNNKADHIGGGIYAMNSEDNIIKNTLESNEAGMGGGLGLADVPDKDSYEITENIIRKNSAKKGGGVAGIFLVYKKEEITTNSHIKSMTGSDNLVTNKYTNLKNNIITDNIAKEFGGGVYMMISARNASTIESNNTVKNNKPDDISEM